MREPPHRSLDAADHHGDVRVQFLQDTGIDIDRVIGTGAGFAVGGVSVVVPEPFRGRVMVNHRVHRARIEGEIEPRPAEFAEVPQVVPPVGLGHDGNAVTPFLEPPRKHGTAEGRMIHKRIPGKKDHVDVIPAEGVHLLFGGRDHRGFRHITYAQEVRYRESPSP